LQPVQNVPVWDALVRVAHWLLAFAVGAAWFTRRGWGALHEWIGYAALAVAAVRILWGFLDTSRARFAEFVAPPAATIRYACSVLTGREPRYIGHNPLGSWMVVALLATVVLTAATGWLYTTDTFWGVAWVERLHAISSDVLFALIALHVAGVLYTSLRHRENLIGAMIHGRKRAPPTGALTSSRAAEDSSGRHRDSHRS
jgi:cytochrome b